MKKTRVTANIQKNRLYFKVIGSLTKKELDALYTDVRFCVADLQPGFDVITDLSECTLANLAGMPTFKKIASYLFTNNVGNVIRVLDEDNLIFKQLINFAAKFQGYESTTVFSLEDAENLLSERSQRDGVRLVLHDQAVKYSLEESHGDGTIIDISLGGCAIRTSDNLPSMDQELLITIEFEDRDGNSHPFELASKTVRVEEGAFAVAYLGLEEGQKDLLWKCMIDQTQQEILF